MNLRICECSSTIKTGFKFLPLTVCSITSTTQLTYLHDTTNVMPDCERTKKTRIGVFLFDLICVLYKRGFLRGIGHSVILVGLAYSSVTC